MVSKRNRILDLINYLESLGIEVNIGKNKARGNKGYFKARANSFRIDIAKNQTENEIERILTHEFAHFVHYKYDKTLNSLTFVFKEQKECYHSEMIDLTVHSIPKSDVKFLFEQKDDLKIKIKELATQIKSVYPEFKQNKAFIPIEKMIKKEGLALLLKYDKVKVQGFFYTKIYSIEELDSYNLDKTSKLYLKLKASQRLLKKYNSKITRLNRYYNSIAELFARTIEYYYFDRPCMQEKAPNVLKTLDSVIEEKSIKEFDIWNKLIKT